ncbi:MAG: hypothetical protein VXY20_03000 [Pseudomonadota bacterium]|nr:hypothetical protein [Pseudomonadota bacterium]
MKTIVLDLDEYLSWRSSEVALRLRLTSGDTSVLTVSENGHDAESIHLKVGSEIEIPAGHWFTIETLGTQSKIAFNKDNFKETIAPPDWRPSPRPSALK